MARRERTREEIIESLYRAAMKFNSPQLQRQARRMENDELPPRGFFLDESGLRTRRVHVPRTDREFVRDLLVGAAGAMIGSYLAKSISALKNESISPGSGEYPSTGWLLPAAVLSSRTAKEPR